MRLLSEALNGVFDEGSEEREIIIEAYNIIRTSNPSVASEAKNHLIMLDRSRVKLSTLYYSISRVISSLKDQIQGTYDSQYVRLVKMGRPSKDAIESEIRATNAEYSGISKKIRDYEDVKDLISMYLRCIDSNRSTVTEILRNIYRID